MITKQGYRAYENFVEKQFSPRGRAYYWIAGNAGPHDAKAGSDGYALMNDYASVTPINLDLTCDELLKPLEARKGLVDRRLAAITGAHGTFGRPAATTGATRRSVKSPVATATTTVLQQLFLCFECCDAPQRAWLLSEGCKCHAGLRRSSNVDLEHSSEVHTVRVTSGAKAIDNTIDPGIVCPMFICFMGDNCVNTDTGMVLPFDDHESVDEPPPGARRHRRGLYARSLSAGNSLSALILSTDERRHQPFSTLLGDGRSG